MDNPTYMQGGKGGVALKNDGFDDFDGENPYTTMKPTSPRGPVAPQDNPMYQAVDDNGRLFNNSMARQPSVDDNGRPFNNSMARRPSVDRSFPGHTVASNPFYRPPDEVLATNPEDHLYEELKPKQEAAFWGKVGGNPQSEDDDIGENGQRQMHPIINASPLLASKADICDASCLSTSASFTHPPTIKSDYSLNLHKNLSTLRIFFAS